MGRAGGYGRYNTATHATAERQRAPPSYQLNFPNSRAPERQRSESPHCLIWRRLRRPPRCHIGLTRACKSKGLDRAEEALISNRWLATDWRCACKVTLLFANESQWTFVSTVASSSSTYPSYFCQSHDSYVSSACKVIYNYDNCWGNILTILYTSLFNSHRV